MASTIQTEEISNLNDKILELQKQVKSFSDLNDNLKNKLGDAEALAKKAHEEKKIEIEALKNSVKKSELATKTLKKDLETEQKVVRENEKLIQKLENKNENVTTNFKQLKTELNKVKNENRKLLKNRTHCTNGLVQTKKNVKSDKSNTGNKEDLNQNIQLSSNLGSSLQTLRAPPITPGRSGQADPSAISPVTSPHVPLSTTPSRTPPVTVNTSINASSTPCSGPGRPSPAEPCTPRTLPGTPSHTGNLRQPISNSDDNSEVDVSKPISQGITVQAKLKEAIASGKKIKYENLVALIESHPWEAETQEPFGTDDEYAECDYGDFDFESSQENTEEPVEIN